MARHQRASRVDTPRTVLIHRAVLVSEIWWQTRLESARETSPFPPFYFLPQGNNRACSPGLFQSPPSHHRDQASVNSHSVPRYQGILAPAIPRRAQRYPMGLGAHCPSLRLTSAGSKMPSGTRNRPTRPRVILKKAYWKGPNIST